MSKDITEGEERFVQKILDDLCGGAEDEPRWMEWILKKQRSKVQDRLIVVSRFRLLSIKRNKMGKKSIQREGHIFNIIKIVVPQDFSDATVFFDGFHIEVTGGDTQGMVKALVEAYHRATSDWPDSAKIAIEGPSDLTSSNEQLGVAEALMGTYEAFCNLYKQRPSTDFKRHVEDTVKAGRTELDLTHCPGIEPRTEYTFDLAPALAALSYNSYFRSFKLNGVPRREAVQIMASPLVKNTTITRLVLAGLDAGPEGFAAIGESLKRNPGNKVCELDFSMNKMSDRGIAGLASGLMTMQHGLLSFNIAHNMITAKGIAALITSLRATEQVSGTIEDLNLAGNKFDNLASQAFADWVTDMKDSALQRLNLCDTAIEFPTVMTGLRLGLANGLSYLDLSHNKIDRQGAQSIALFIEKSQALNFLNLAYCRLPPEAFDPMLAAMKANSSLRELKLIFAGNAIGTGAQRFANSIAAIDSLHTLNLRDNGLKVDGLKIVLQAVSSHAHLKCLDVGVNIVDKTPNTKQLNEAFTDFLSRNQSVETLQVTGDPAKNIVYGAAISALFDALAGNSRLTELDISGNRCGDRAAVAISDALRKNTTLTYLNWDNNGIAMGGYQAFKSCLETSNKTIFDVPFPRLDVDRSVGASKDAGRLRQRINELFLEINTFLKNNREASPHAGTIVTNMTSRKMAEYKEPPMDAPPPRAVKTLRKPSAATTRAKPTFTVYNDDGSQPDKYATERSPRTNPGNRSPRGGNPFTPPAPPAYGDDDDFGDTPPPAPSPRTMAPPPPGYSPGARAPDWGTQSLPQGRGAGAPKPPVFGGPPTAPRPSNPAPPVFNGAASVGGRGRGGPLRPPAGPPPTPAPPPSTPPAPPVSAPPVSAPPPSTPPVAPPRRQPPAPPARTAPVMPAYEEDDSSYNTGGGDYYDDDDDAPPPPPREDYDEDEMYNYG